MFLGFVFRACGGLLNPLGIGPVNSFSFQANPGGAHVHPSRLQLASTSMAFLRSPCPDLAAMAFNLDLSFFLPEPSGTRPPGGRYVFSFGPAPPGAAPPFASVGASVASSFGYSLPAFGQGFPPFGRCGGRRNAFALLPLTLSPCDRFKAFVLLAPFVPLLNLGMSQDGRLAPCPHQEVLPPPLSPHAFEDL